MIISYSKKIYIVHTPKCGGTTITNLFRKFDEKEGDKILEKLKSSNYKQDSHHLPLFSLKELLPDIYDTLIHFESYAIIRNPYERFISSVAQHLGMYKGEQFKNLDYKNILEEIDTIIKYLTKNEAIKLLPKEYIHFQKQIDYIYLNNKQIVKNIYTISQIDQLIQELKLKFAINDINVKNEVKKSNQTIVYKNSRLKDLKRILEKIKIFKLFKLLPSSIKHKLNKHLYSDINVLRSKILSEKNIITFIDRYYADDIKLYKAFTQKLDLQEIEYKLNEKF